ncbi:MAG TPA: pilus assembly protein TadG-related protein [Candidatus Dormibacteraeota bacterium]|nr:pilus assembly protein TadG-related protein [Candidatus Dormibacteraeota bacterium]
MRRPSNTGSSCERGATLVFVGVSLLALLSVLALVIDLGMLYVARSEAQRAADAAALAGANVFVTTGCTSVAGTGCVAGGSQELLAANQALAVAALNNVAGQPASIDCPEYADPTSGSAQCPGITFSYPTQEEPQISVTVVRSGIPTIFAKMFGVQDATVSAKAVAEAYNPSGGQAGTDARITPFLIPNCNPNAIGGPNANPYCPVKGANYFIDNSGQLVSNVAGESWNLHFGTTSASDSATPSEWYMISIWPSGGSQSASQMAAAISQSTTVSCNLYYPALLGKKVGPLDSGVETLINATGQSTNGNYNQGQDQITVQNPETPNFSYTVQAGSNNPLVQNGVLTAGQNIVPATNSGSIVNAAVFDGAICGMTVNGTVLTTSNSDCIGPGGGTVKVLGWMQIFIQGATHQGSYDGVSAVILNVSGCPASSTIPSVNSGGSAIPIRLIQKAD